MNAPSQDKPLGDFWYAKHQEDGKWCAHNIISDFSKVFQDFDALQDFYDKILYAQNTVLRLREEKGLPKAIGKVVQGGYGIDFIDYCLDENVTIRLNLDKQPLLYEFLCEFYDEWYIRNS